METGSHDTTKVIYDEMYVAPSEPRDHYSAVYDQITSMGHDDLVLRQQAADQSFLHQGVTFTVYGDEDGTEKIFPYDLIPRIITADEWATIERGLKQRIYALNLFLHDVYNEGKILADGVVPNELIFTCKHFRREMRGVSVPQDIYVSIVGTDLVRISDGSFAVLEDNLRVPSGVSYMLANRQVMKRVFPKMFGNYGVRAIDNYGRCYSRPCETSPLGGEMSRISFC